MCKKAVANTVMLYLQHDFCNIIFKIKHKLYIPSGLGSPPPPQTKILGAHLMNMDIVHAFHIRNFSTGVDKKVCSNFNFGALPF
jgi:hypothetical protein